MNQQALIQRTVDNLKEYRKLIVDDPEIYDPIFLKQLDNDISFWQERLLVL